MAVETFNRYEHKYLLNEQTYKKVISALKSHIKADSHNNDSKPYTISNIYYDTDEDYLIRTSISKPEYKEKLRLRSYGIPNPDSKVFLEIKKKCNGIVNKRRSVFRLDEAYRFLSSGIVPKAKDYMNMQVVNELAYFLKIYDLKPRLYLAYDRIAFFEKTGLDLRISFDTNIRSRRYDLRLESGDFGTPLLDSNVYLMEIKTAFAKPIWLTEILTQLEIYRTSFSKYGTEYKKSVTSANSKEKLVI